MSLPRVGSWRDCDTDYVTAMGYLEQATNEGATASLREYDVGERYCPSRSSAKGPVGSYLADPCPATLKPACACHARTFLPSVHLANALTKHLSSVPVLAIAVFGKRKVTLRFLAGADRSHWHNATFLCWHGHRTGTHVQGA